MKRRRGLEVERGLQNNRISILPAKKENRLNQAWKHLRIPVLCIAIATSFVIGFIGFQKYSQLSGSGYNELSSIYASLELFKFSGGVLSTPIPWELEVARWLSPFLAAYALVFSIASLFKKQLREAGVSFYKQHVVICGLGKKGLLLARNFHKSGYKVVVIEIDPANPFVSVCRDDGIIVIAGDARDKPTLKKANIQGADYLVCVTGEDVLNSDIALIAKKSLVQRRSGKLNCSIHVEDPTLWTLLRLQEFTSRQSEHFRLDFFNIYDQGAKQLLQEYPIQNDGDSQGEPHLFFIGFSSFSEQLLLNTSRQWIGGRSQSGRKFKASIVDPEAGKYKARIKRQFSLIDNTSVIEGHSTIEEAGEGISQEFTRDKLQSRASRIYIHFEDENIGLTSALSILNRIQEEGVEVIVTMNEEIGLAALIKENAASNDRLRKLHFFGLLERTCTPNLVFNSMNESITRSIHSNYLEMMATITGVNANSANQVPWEELGEDLKEMNRDQADSIGGKLRSISCEIIPWTDYGAQEFTFTGEEIEKMAKMEHERWAQQKLLQGWKYAPARDDQKKEHPSLLSWDDPGFSESEKEKDRNSVQQIPYLLASAGYQIYCLDSKVQPGNPSIRKSGR
jgi:hypothetical protein